MALTIISSNRVETLQFRLVEQLVANPPDDPFACEIIVVPTFAMSRWLNLRIAQQQGIAANIDYPQPGKWIWQLARQVLGEIAEEDPYSLENLAWRIFDALPGLLTVDAFKPLASYLEDDAGGVKRWQLSQRIANSFDRYQLYRPQKIRDWSRGEESHWQALLWREIVSQQQQPHRVDVISQLLARLAEKSLGERPAQRVSLFALSSLPPLYVEVIQALSAHIDLQLYLHCPTDQYWADLASEKLKSRNRIANPEQDELYETRNELLASWGRQGQLFQDLLLDNDSLQAYDLDLFDEPDSSSLLGKIQQSIFTLALEPQRFEADNSLTLHCCHSAMRECQILHDQLLAMLEDDNSLNPEDILVMVPDIAGYAPYIEAIFQHASQSRLACNISDTTSADEHPMVVTFLQLLGLPQSRFPVSEILALLDNESLRSRFDIDDQSLPEIHQMIQASNARWGIDAAHKAEMNLPATAANTWQQARDRFFAGFSLGEDQLWHGIAPLDAWGEADIQTIGRFWFFFDRLSQWRKRLAKTQTAADWQLLLLQLIDDFFVETDTRESRLQQIRDAVTAIPVNTSALISPMLITYLLRQQLDSQEQSGRLYSGGVTFCGMRPMRSVPFRVICLLGMNAEDFPRRDEPTDFELMANDFIAGDPSKRNEDRYLMLETLLCARDRLYISYTGRSLKDNSPRQASLMVEELLDFIDHHFSADAQDGKPSKSLLQQHPMQVFSALNYQCGEASYNRYWYEVCQQIGAEAKQREPGWSRPLLPLPEEKADIELDQLRGFMRSPIDYFFKSRLGLFLGSEDPTEDDEPFELNKLQQWKLKQQLGEDLLRQQGDVVARMHAEGGLPHGHAAQAQVDSIARQQSDWLTQLQAYSGKSTQAIPLELSLTGDARLVGVLAGYYPGLGLLACHPGNFRGYQLLALWLDHLALCANALWADGEQSLLLASDQSWSIEALPADQALRLLEDYCAIYRQGMQCPLPILADSSYRWASSDNREKTMASIAGQWFGQWSQANSSEADNEYVQLAMRGCGEAPFETDAFTELAERIYTQLLLSARKL